MDVKEKRNRERSRRPGMLGLAKQKERTSRWNRHEKTVVIQGEREGQTNHGPEKLRGKRERGKK